MLSIDLFQVVDTVAELSVVFKGTLLTDEDAVVHLIVDRLVLHAVYTIGVVLIVSNSLF